MYKQILFLLITIFMIGCSTSKPQPPKPSEKTFAQEDTYILFALRAEQVHDNKTAGKLFFKLYEKSKKKEYLYRALQNQLIAKEYDSVIKKVNALSDGSFSDPKLIRLKIIALFAKNNLEKAKTLALALAHHTQSPDDYIIVSDILIKQGENNLALKYLEGAYVKEYNEKILDKMAIILYVNLNRKKDAIAHLESHTRIHGCSELICKRLLGIYSRENDLNGLLSVYKRLYRLKKDDKIAKKIIQIYAYKRDYIKLMNFLEQYHVDDSLLLELYTTAKDYTKASQLAERLYKQTGSLKYLGESAIYEYEAHKEKLSKKTLDDVVAKLTQVVQGTKEILYMNYLGYILIDHEIDVQKGMAYIREVLKSQPNSAYYLDSLAWGYYKEGECKEANLLMQKIKKLKGGDDPEVLKHAQEIEACIHNSHYKKVVLKR